MQTRLAIGVLLCALGCQTGGAGVSPDGGSDGARASGGSAGGAIDAGGAGGATSAGGAGGAAASDAADAPSAPADVAAQPPDAVAPDDAEIGADAGYQGADKITCNPGTDGDGKHTLTSGNPPEWTLKAGVTPGKLTATVSFASQTYNQHFPYRIYTS